MPEELTDLTAEERAALQAEVRALIAEVAQLRAELASLRGERPASPQG